MPTDPEKLRAATRKRLHEAPDAEMFGLNTTALGAAQEFFRMGRRQVSVKLEARAEKLGLRLEHLGVTIGTVIHNVDLSRELSDEVIDFIKATQLERKVVFFRDQHITVDQQVAFAQRFGPLDAFPFGDHVEGQPLVLRIAGIGNRGANNWHTDVTWMERPSNGSILHMVEAPEIGGDTLFSDSHAAYLGLPNEVKQQLEGVCGIHDYRGFRRDQRAAGVSDESLLELEKAIPFGVSHPLIRTHPETGKQALYLHAGFLRHDSLHGADGPWDKERSKRLVAFLMQQHSKPEYQCRFKYQNGSIAFWDNRACQHCASTDYFPYTRRGHRVTLSGTRPFFNPDAVAVSEPLSTSSASRL